MFILAMLAVLALWWIALSFYHLCAHFIHGTTKTVDVERAKVYGEHLGAKLREGK